MDIRKIGLFLKTKRKQKAITQSQVATQLGLSPQAISKWERGENLPDITYFPDIATLYDTTIDAILSAGAVEKQTSPLPHIQLFDEAIFVNIIELIKTNQYIADVGISLDFFPYLSKQQKHILLDNVLAKQDYTIAIEDIIPTATSTDKFRILDKLLSSHNFDMIEDIITFLSRRHRVAIVDFIVEHNIPLHIAEGFIPFVDKTQAERIRRRIV